MKSMEEVVGDLLASQHKTIACAESCTGGLLTSRLTDIPGSSAYVMGSVVCYTNKVKEQLAGVQPETIAAYTEVSAETAGEMAQGIRQRIGTDIGVGITGLAGPGGGSNGQPVGLVYIAVAGARGTTIREHHFRGDRKEIKQKSAETALQMIHDYLSGGTF
ncbi:nicotinamide-nucleotide amidohydrolase family protein [Selenomonas caprae]|uniref:Nicotinamide-nucleotide amidohydrolase family protein n=1 Tax=Selenomonas caprae TaxID=2606905 RepID=A0A5D6WJT1_9FIRM|nr:nicotinamide-nucleotide amidohydrolase family protein [Selenomonas caprae]TYZ28336.1 nicotinamide-nucleotide amidohydrolase family protein [Selenomonas caprae]